MKSLFTPTSVNQQHDSKMCPTNGGSSQVGFLHETLSNAVKKAVSNGLSGLFALFVCDVFCLVVWFFKLFKNLTFFSLLILTIKRTIQKVSWNKTGPELKRLGKRFP